MKKSRDPQHDAENEQAQPLEELFLLHLRYKEAQLVEVGGNKPILLDDRNTSWVVYSGHVNVFAVQLKNGRIAGPRHHLFRIESGGALFGINLPPDATTTALLAVGGNETRLLKIATHRLQILGRDEEFRVPVAGLLESWVRGLTGSLLTGLPPKDCRRLADDDRLNLHPADTVCARKEILWVQHVQGKSRFLGETTFPTVNGTGYWPLTNRSWLQAEVDSQLQTISTITYVQGNNTWADLDTFTRQVLARIELRLRTATQTQKSQLQSKLATDRETVRSAISHLAAPLATDDASEIFAPLQQESGDLLFRACLLIGRHLGVDLEMPPASSLPATVDGRLRAICRASRLQMRKVGLRDQWWQKDNGPLLALREESGQPVALLPRSATAYDLYDPATESAEPVTEAVALSLEPFAYMLYQALPARTIGLVELLRFGIRGSGHDLRTIILMSSTVSLLGLLIPVATQFIIDTIIPNQDLPQIIQLGLLLLFITLAIGLFQVTQNLAILRLQGRMGANVQAAVWDRLLTLPISFFRDYTSGDLGDRAMGITIIQRALSGTVLHALLSGTFSMLSFLLLYSYSPRLALAALGLILLSVGVTAVAGTFRIRYLREMMNIQGDISGLVLQTINGVAKFRATGTEGRAFASWADAFSRLKHLHYRSRNITNNLAVFNSGYIILATAVVFSMVAFSSTIQLTTGTFLAFNAAFAQLLFAVLALNQTFIRILDIIPIYERARPILQAVPEVDEVQKDPGTLTGKIEVSHVSFRYREDAPLVLEDVSLTVEPGEFVALVGPSGSGKSTLFRILLGFEKPESGAVYYEDQDLATLDVRKVRNQMGVVLQNGAVMAGDIVTNIIGATSLTVDDAWQAARMAGFDKDIEGMPMGMHTVLNAGGGTLSGGQRQRMMIARAIVNKPRILYFDEATSALDNQTQAIVSDSLDNLQATRIVIAHRLSTIMNADKIYVLENGRVVQAGTYQELMKEEGVFAEMAKRQVA